MSNKRKHARPEQQPAAVDGTAIVAYPIVQQAVTQGMAKMRTRLVQKYALEIVGKRSPED